MQQQCPTPAAPVCITAAPNAQQRTYNHAYALEITSNVLSLFTHPNMVIPAAAAASIHLLNAIRR